MFMYLFLFYNIFSATNVFRTRYVCHKIIQDLANKITQKCVDNKRLNLVTLKLMFNLYQTTIVALCNSMRMDELSNFRRRMPVNILKHSRPKFKIMNRRKSF